MSMWSLTYRKSEFKRYHSDKHFSEFTYKTARKINWHRYGTKLRVCHPVYTTSLLPNFQVYQHIKEIPAALLVISSARRPAPPRTRYTDRLNRWVQWRPRNVPRRHTSTQCNYHVRSLIMLIGSILLWRCSSAHQILKNKSSPASDTFNVRTHS